MARQFEEMLKAILTGAATGAQTGMASGQEIQKALMLERLKRQLMPEDIELKRAQAEWYKRRASAAEPLIETPEGYEYGYSSTGKRILKPSKKPTETDLFRDNLRRAKQAIRTGESSIEEELSILEDLYPEKDFTTQKLQWKGLIPKPPKTQPTGKSLFQKVGEGASVLGRGFMGLLNRPGIQTKIQKARELGYSDEQIAAYLKSK